MSSALIVENESGVFTDKIKVHKMVLGIFYKAAVIKKTWDSMALKLALNFGKTCVVAFALCAAAWAGDGPSFLAGGSFLVSQPALNVVATGGGLNFDFHVPVRAFPGMEFGLRNFLQVSRFATYANTTVNGNTKDEDRQLYWAGTAIGPKITTKGTVYFVGTAGVLIAANYAVITTYGTSSHMDNAVVSEKSAVSYGGEGSVGFGWRHRSGFNLEFVITAEGASSENAPGVMMAIGPKLTVGLGL